MGNHQGIIYYLRKSFRETLMGFMVILILTFLAIKFGNSPISILLNSFKYWLIIIGAIIFISWFLIIFLINYAYGQLDISSKKRKNTKGAC